MRERRRPTRTLARGVAIGVLVLWILGPLYFLALVSVQTDAESLAIPPRWWPGLDLGNYARILSRATSDAPPSQPSDLVLPGIVNSAVVATSVAVVNVTVGALAGYGFARFRFPGVRTIPLAMLASQMVPAFAVIVPYYVVLRVLGLTNTRSGVVVALLSITLPFTVWLLRSSFRDIPPDLERAARMDGCGRMAAFLRVAVPLVRPALISTGLFAFMVSWNDFLFALVLSVSRDAILVQPAIAGLYNVREQSFGMMGAGSLLAALPTMLFALAMQRYLVRGLLSGTGKV